MSLNNPYVNPLAPEEEYQRNDYQAFMNEQLMGNTGKTAYTPTTSTLGNTNANVDPEEQKRLDYIAFANEQKGGTNGTPNAAENTSNSHIDYSYTNPYDEKVQQSLYDYIDGFTRFAERPLDAAEREKREKAATAIGGIGALGNVANAFSNLIFTGKGAPSQTLPERPDFDKEIDKFRADERTKVKNYMANSAAKMAAFIAERDAYNTRKDKEIAISMQRQKTEAELAKLAQQMEVYKQQGNKYAFDALASQYKAIQEAAKAENAPTSIALDNDYKQAGINQRNASAYRSRAGAASSLSTAALNGEKLNQLRNGSSINLEVGGNKIARYNPKKVDDTNINQLIGKMPKEVQEAYKIEMRMSGKSIEARRAIQRQYIAEAITQYPDVEVLADRLGIISYDDNVSTSKKSVKKTSTKKGNASSSSKGGFPD